MDQPTQRRVLISGASVAGPVAAFWLNRAGWDVTLVERAGQVRGGGYPIDLRGTAVEVVKRMGVHAEIRKQQVGHRSTAILNQRGKQIASLDMSADVLNDNDAGDVELPRGALAEIFYEATRNDIEYVFNDSLASIDQHEDRVEVTFVSGRSDTFDFVIGADGIHSTTRRLAFGPEENYIHHLGPCVAIFDMEDPNVGPGMGTMFNLPGRFAMQLRDNTGPLRGFLAFVVDDPDSVDTEDTKAAHVLARNAFAGHEIDLVRRLLQAMPSVDDLYFDTVSQIRMDCWHNGRVVLAGDSAYAPSFLSGQGTSIAVVGAYILASELALNSDPGTAFTGYENKLREFIESNQQLALRAGHTALPRDKKSLRQRNLKLRAIPWLRRTGLLKLLNRGYRETATSLSIDGYGLS